MTSTSLDLSNHIELEPAAALVASIQAAGGNARFIVVGARAIELVMGSGYGVHLSRTTTDYYFGVSVADWDQFHALRETLLGPHAFKADQAKLHRLHSPHGLMVDLVPFGAIERPDRTIAWPPDDQQVLNAFGFNEAAARAVPVALPNNVIVHAIAPPGQALLKLTAWQERTERPPRDAADLGVLLSHYIDANNHDRFIDDTSLIDAVDGDLRQGGSRILGRDIRAMLDEQGLQRVEAIVAPEIDPNGPQKLASDISWHDSERILPLIRAFYAGLTGN